jgi:NAD(P)H-hydrate epimerase
VAGPLEVLENQPDALVIGPGLVPPSTDWHDGFIQLLETTSVPLVLDAEALNFLAVRQRLDLLRSNHLLTPLPGEFARLAPDLAALPREEAARRFVDRHPCALLLKGCRTLVTAAGEPLWCNPTGHPGMAVGGQGDTLAGVIGARLAIGDPLVTAACFASWCCGRAAEIAVDHLGAGESYTPTTGLDHLGAALRDWRERRR